MILLLGWGSRFHLSSWSRNRGPHQGLCEASELGAGGEPVGGGRGVVGPEERPVLMNQPEALHGPVGAERGGVAPGIGARERRTRTRVNGAPSLPVAAPLDHH